MTALVVAHSFDPYHGDLNNRHPRLGAPVIRRTAEDSWTASGLRTPLARAFGDDSAETDSAELVSSAQTQEYTSETNALVDQAWKDPTRRALRDGECFAPQTDPVQRGRLAVIIQRRSRARTPSEMSRLHQWMVAVIGPVSDAEKREVWLEHRTFDVPPGFGQTEKQREWRDSYVVPLGLLSDRLERGLSMPPAGDVSVLLQKYSEQPQRRTA